MSLSNVIPAWVLTGDSIIKQYHEGRIDLERAKAKLEQIGAPESMVNRLYNSQGYE